MKILLVITKSEIGGAQEHVRALASGARAAGNEVMVACGKDGWLTSEMKRLGIRTVILPGLERSWNPLATAKYTAVLKWLLAAEKPDVVHFHSSNALFGLPTARGSAVAPRVFATVHGMSLLHPGWKKSVLLKAAYRITLRRLLKAAHRVVFVCQADLDLALAQQLVSPEQTITILNGIAPDLALRSREEARTRLGLPRDGFVFGAVSRFEYAKNVGLLVEAFGRAKLVAKLGLIGSGPEETKVRALAAVAAPDKIVFAGTVPEARHYLKAFDVLVLPSRYEGLPYAVLEAMSAGIPVIATAVGGVPELIEDGVSGLLVPPEDPAALSAAMTRLFSNPALAKSLAEAAGVKIRSDFSETAMTEKILEMYRDKEIKRESERVREWGAGS